MRKPSRKVARRPWSDADRLEFASGNILRAKTVPAKRRPGPSAVDWAQSFLRDYANGFVGPEELEARVFLTFMIQQPDLNKLAMAEADVQVLDKEGRLARMHALLEESHALLDSSCEHRQEVTESEAPRQKFPIYNVARFYDWDIPPFDGNQQ